MKKNRSERIVLSLAKATSENRLDWKTNDSASFFAKLPTGHYVSLFYSNDYPTVMLLDAEDNWLETISNIEIGNAATMQSFQNMYDQAYKIAHRVDGVLEEIIESLG